MAEAQVLRMSELQDKAAGLHQVGNESTLQVTRCAAPGCLREGWDVQDILTCHGCKRYVIANIRACTTTCCQGSRKVCIDHRFAEGHDCPAALRKHTQTASNTPQKPRPKDVSCGSAGCSEKITARLQDTQVCQNCHIIFCRSRGHLVTHKCKGTSELSATTSTASRLLAARNAALAKFKAANAEKRATAAKKQSPGSAANPVVVDGDTGPKRGGFFSRSSAAPPQASARIPSNEIVISKTELQGNKNLAESKRCTISVQAKVDEELVDEKKSVTKVYKMRAFFNEDWVIGRVMDESLRLLGLANPNSSAVPQEQKWGTMFEDGNRGELIDANMKLKAAKAAHPGMTLTVRKGYMLDREETMSR